MKEPCKEIIAQFKNRRVLVIGDALLDTYITGFLQKLCREAPAPVLTVEEQKHYCGGAANTAINTAALGAETSLLTVLGNDDNGKILLKKLNQNGINTSHILLDPGRKTIAKRRLIASGTILVRADEGDTTPVSPETGHRLRRILRAAAFQADVIILSDYGFGVLNTALIQAIREVRRKKDIPLIIDSRNLEKFKKLSPTGVKPNYEESIALLRLPAVPQAERLAQLRKYGRKLLEITGACCVAATMDQDGTLVFETGRKAFHISCMPGDPKKAIGAGDTYISAFSLALGSEARARTAAVIAGAAASVVIRKEGTGICSAGELQACFTAHHKYIESLAALACKVKEMRKARQRVVFTNGCFDILHRGHVTMLERAKALGDVLVVGLNTDESIKRVKGADRPINTLEDRIAVLEGLQSVTYLVAFEEDLPEHILRIVKPDIYVKGRTYTTDELPEASLVKKLGGEVKILPLACRSSTTELIRRIRMPYNFKKYGPIRRYHSRKIRME